MADRWFIVPRTGTGTDDDPYRPKYADTADIDGWSGQVAEIGNNQQYVARFYGTAAALDTVEGNNDVRSVPGGGVAQDQIADHLNRVTGQSMSFAGWQDRFEVG